MRHIVSSALACLDFSVVSILKSTKMYARLDINMPKKQGACIYPR